MNRFVKYEDAEDILAHGTTKSSLRLSNGLQVDVRVMGAQQFGSALLYFTGSKSHNIALRTRAQEMGLKVTNTASSGGRRG